jgi:hypothetical protein
VTAARGRAGNAMTRLHLQDVSSEIERILDPRANRSVADASASSSFGMGLELPSPLPFDPDGWMEMMGIAHPAGWQAAVREWLSSSSGEVQPLPELQ